MYKSVTRNKNKKLTVKKTKRKSKNYKVFEKSVINLNDIKTKQFKKNYLNYCNKVGIERLNKHLYNNSNIFPINKKEFNLFCSCSLNEILKNKDLTNIKPINCLKKIVKSQKKRYLSSTKSSTKIQKNTKKYKNTKIQKNSKTFKKLNYNL
jgi:hypothetical protein